MSKIKLGIFPEHAQEKGIAYWEKVQNNFIKKYGVDDHKAALNICKEINVTSETNYLVNKFGFKNTKKIYADQSLDVKICVYSDMRVSPMGVVSLTDRLEEVRKWYLTKMTGIYTLQQFSEFIPLWSKIEEQIFYKCKIKPHTITDRKVMQQILKLKSFNISTN